MALYREHAIVLRTWKLGEADRIVSFVTRGRGKVRAVAKGVRRTKSKFGGRLEPTSHVAAQFYEGRNLDIVLQAESIDQFPGFRTDVERFSRASAMLEVVDQVVQEHETNPQLYDLLLGALRTLARENAALVLPGFFLKLLALEGQRPVLDHCAECGAEDELVAFSFLDGGVLCVDCRRGRPLSGEALALLRLVLGGQLARALEEPASAATGEVTTLATDAVEQFLERPLRSLWGEGLR